VAQPIILKAKTANGPTNNQDVRRPRHILNISSRLEPQAVTVHFNTCYQQLLWAANKQISRHTNSL